MMEHGGTHLPSRSRWLLATLIGAALVMEARPSSAVLACCLTWQSWRQLMCSPPPSGRRGGFRTAGGGFAAYGPGSDVALADLAACCSDDRRVAEMGDHDAF
jgi:hypothetical protein